MSNDETRIPNQVSSAPDRYLANTHEVINQPSVLADYNLYATDRALREAVVAQGGQWDEPALVAFGANGHCSCCRPG